MCNASYPFRPSNRCDFSRSDEPRSHWRCPIGEGNTSLADVQKYGLSFNWEVRGKTINGYGNVDGKGKITEFKQGL
jgi:hypothetical protein